uniref:Putative DNA methylase n=1 Tax=Edwardsiella ictaluri TaxID=67780 RepID=A0A7U3Q6Z5_EDWIC|nr:putative DNA methylase [Edwardsiella ictaluri]
MINTSESKKNKCEHNNLEKEYYLGSATGDYVCVDCGATGYGRDWPEREAENDDNA